MTDIKIGYLRALVVDDSTVSRMAMENMLEKLGFKHLDVAQNAAEAYKKMAALRYDVVFLDWVMPGQSGISLLQEWREDRNYDGVAICVVSMNNDKSQIAGALKAGALSYIVKPATEETLQRNIDKVLEWLQLRRAFVEKQNS